MSAFFNTNNIIDKSVHAVPLWSTVNIDGPNYIAPPNLSIAEYEESEISNSSDSDYDISDEAGWILPQQSCDN